MLCCFSAGSRDLLVVRIMLYLCERAVLLMWSWYAHQRHMVIAQACDAASGSTCRGSVSDGGERQRAQARAHLLHGEPCHTHHLSQSMLSSPHHLRIARNLFWMQREDLLRRTPSDGLATTMPVQHWVGDPESFKQI